jgi:hypothetical protein
MLALDDPRWAELEHAYGPAGDVPELLRRLAEAPGPGEDVEAEPWFSLWSALHHQGDVCTATYAAVPHVVRIACETRGVIDFSFFQFPASVEAARAEGRGPDLPADLADAYREAVARLPEAAAAHFDDFWDESTTLSVAAALAVAKGQLRVARALLDLDDDMMDRIVAGEWE